MFTPLPPKEEQAADALMTNFFCRFGVPMVLHSDQGQIFESKLRQGVMERLEVSKTRTTLPHPLSNGMVERYVKTIKEHSTKVTLTYQQHWNEWLPIFLLAYRASTHETQV